MCLVDHYELERDIHDDILEVQKKHLITSDKYLELIEFRGDSSSSHGDVEMKPFIILDASSSWLTVLVVVENAIHVGPFLHCPLPVFKSRKRGDYQERAFYVLHGEEMVQKGNRLDGLSQAHLVS